MLEDMIFTVASYNIHKGCGLDRRVKLDRIAAVLEEIDADLVGLQEVLHPQADALAERLGMHVAMGPTHDRTAVPYGNAVLTRFPIHRSHTFDLSWAEREPRGGIRLDLTVADELLHVFNVHFGLKVRESCTVRASAARIRPPCPSFPSTASTGTATSSPTASTCTGAGSRAWPPIICPWWRGSG